MAIVNGGTIPDRGLYGVFLAGDEGRTSRRVGELDEEMVYEARTGDVFQLGASSWRILEITHDRVLVEPAPGEAGTLPFWRGDGPGRNAELGEAIGRLVREVDAAEPEAAAARLRSQDQSIKRGPAPTLEEPRVARNATRTDDVVAVLGRVLGSEREEVAGGI